MGAARAALVQTHHLTSDFQDKLDQAMASTADSLQSLECQITSLAGTAFQTREGALHFLTAEGRDLHGVGEECCFYVSESRLVEQDEQMLKDLPECYVPTPRPQGTQTLWSLAPSLLGLATAALLLLARCLI